MAGRRHYRPFLKTALATLVSSARIVAKDRGGHLDQGFVDDVLAQWSADIFRFGNATITCVGAERYAHAHLPPHGEGRSYVVMSNHQSLLDVPSIFHTFPGRVRMVGKAELGRIPVWGQAMRAGGVVFVDRGDRAQSIAALEDAKRQLREGTNIWIAPEGTRRTDGELGPLKKGGFHLAAQLGVPIAPAWITGTAAIISPDSFGVQLDGHVEVRYGPSITTAGRDVAALLDETRDALLALRAKAAAPS
jgi:1-acyl-sn-glycerol-3-phosphate acyltransferase